MYVAVKGGEQAIDNAHALLAKKRPLRGSWARPSINQGPAGSRKAGVASPCGRRTAAKRASTAAQPGSSRRIARSLGP